MGRRHSPARDLQALELQVKGLTYQQIADELHYATRSAAYKAVQRALASERAQEQDRTVEDHRRLELAKLGRMEAALRPAADRGDLGAVDRLIKITDRRARLLGLNVSVNAPHQPATPVAEGDNVVSLTDRLVAMRQGLPGAGT